MSRNPVDLEAQGPKADRQAMWERIRDLHRNGQPVTIKAVWSTLPPDVPKNRVGDYMVGLERAGYLQRLNPDRRTGEPVIYILVRDIGAEAPRVRRDGSEPGRPGREQLWRTLRIIGEFSAAELADAASIPGSPIAHETALEYCYFLRRAGYLALTRESKPGIPERYRLVPSCWTGPQAPMIQRTKRLFDPNTGQVVVTNVTKTEGGEP